MASYSGLPEPMLARSGRLPTVGDYSYEVKWEGFRAIVSTEGQLRVRSRRGWDMTPHVGFLIDLPVRAVLDGELVALDADGKPDFPQLCECVLMRRTSAPLTFIAFDVLSVDGTSVTGLAYTDRREILDGLGLNDRYWRTTETFDDGAALWEAVCAHELEGVVAKRWSGRYLPGSAAGSRRRTATTGARSELLLSQRRSRLEKRFERIDFKAGLTAGVPRELWSPSRDRPDGLVLSTGTRSPAPRRAT